MERWRAATSSWNLDDNTWREKIKKEKNTRLNCNMERDATVGTHVDFTVEPKQTRSLSLKNSVPMGLSLINNIVTSTRT